MMHFQGVGQNSGTILMDILSFFGLFMLFDTFFIYNEQEMWVYVLFFFLVATIPPKQYYSVNYSICFVHGDSTLKENPLALIQCRQGLDSQNQSQSWDEKIYMILARGGL